MAILPDLLALSNVTGVFSRIKAPGDVIQRFYGMQMGGPNVDTITTRHYTYDVFDYQRGIARGRAPGTGPARVAPVPVGSVAVRVPRFYEKVELDYETLSNIRAIGENAGVQDKMGLKYIERQARELKRKQQNAREFLVGSILRGGSWAMWTNGEDFIPVYSLGSATGFTVDMQVPAGNKTKLDMLGAGDIIGTSWDNTNAPIIGDLLQISGAFQQLVGMPLDTVWVNDDMWLNVLKNTQVINTAGSANTPFAQYEMLKSGVGTNEDSQPVGLQRAVLRGIPWVTWNIYSGVVEVLNTSTGAATTTKLIPDNTATFHIKHDPSWFDFVDGGEIVKENAMAPAVMRTGHVAWAKEVDEPARVELHSLQNGLPRLTVPKAVAHGTVVF